MKRKAFSLIEALIATGIAVVILGASVSANRAVRNNAQLAEDRLVMTGLADETINNIWSVKQNGYEDGGSLSYSLSDLFDDGFAGFFYRSADLSLPNKCGKSGSKRDCSQPIPLALQWCSMFGNSSCQNTSAPVKFSTQFETACTGNNVKAGEIFGCVSSIASRYGHPNWGGEVVAVRRKASTSALDCSSATLPLNASCQQLVDIANPLTGATIVIDKDSLPYWNYYVRQLNITKDSGKVIIDVNVFNYNNPSSSVAKTVSITER